MFLSDLTTFTAAAYSVSTPGLIGQNAEWMVSRSCCDNDTTYGTIELANTARIFFDDGAAGIDGGSSKATWLYPGSQASSTLILTMTDDQGNENIETVNQGKNSGYEGQHALEFSTVGCAYGQQGGCTP